MTADQEIMSTRDESDDARLAGHSLADTYLPALEDLLTRLRTQQPTLLQAGRLVADAIASGHLLHLFGTGHSHLLAEEGLYRAGGLAAVNAMLVPEVMLHTGAVASSAAERTTGRAAALADRYALSAGDVLCIFSNSGVNAVPVELAQYARQHGLRVIAVLSLSYAQQARSTSTDGMKLHEVAEVVVDNGLPPGDALVPLPDQSARMGPGSTVIGAAALHAILLVAAEELLARGLDVPAYVSSNMPGALAHDSALVDRFRGRIRHL